MSAPVVRYLAARRFCLPEFTFIVPQCVKGDKRATFPLLVLDLE